MLDLHVLAVESGWNNSVLKAVYRQGLNKKIIKKLACHDESVSLDTLIHLPIILDKRKVTQEQNLQKARTVSSPHRLLPFLGRKNWLCCLIPSQAHGTEHLTC